MKYTVWQLGMFTHHGTYNYAVYSMAAASPFCSCWVIRNEIILNVGLYFQQ